MKNLNLYIFILVIFTKIKSNINTYIESYKNEQYVSNLIKISVSSISYELSYKNYSTISVKIKIFEQIPYNISFKAFLKNEENLNQYILDCSNGLNFLIVCFSRKNISLERGNIFFYYDRKISGLNLRFNESDIFQDNKKISLIFKPEVIDNQILFSDKKIFKVKIKNNTLSGGNLFIAKKSKNILKAPKNGFNKYIELNNFIPRGGLGILKPPWTLLAYKEAIRRGYKMVDADVLFTKDKIPVIAHDLELKEVSNGEGYLPNKTIEELEKLDFSIKFDKKYSGEKIVRFDEILKLCKKNNIILDLDLGHLKYKEFLENKREYIKILIEYVEKNDMVNSILFNDKRQEILDIFYSIKKDISFSINGMNEKSSIEKIKDKYNDSKIIVYNMGGLYEGKKINEDAVKYGLSLGRKTKTAKIDDINFANKVIKWGINFIVTNKLEPFLMINDKEEPIKINCFVSINDSSISICEIDDNINLIDNEIYSIYYSSNIYNISQNIVDVQIGEFKYINTNSADQLYYDIIYFNFKEGIIRLNTSKPLKTNESLVGAVGPSYEYVENCYIYKFICSGDESHIVECIINKNDDEKVEFAGNYTIYFLEGYSFNPVEVYNKLNYLSIKRKKHNFMINIIIMIFIIIAIIYLKIYTN